ncbi:MAG: MFS transporter [Planctomycetes bacterium]|nr:MFS transporter [Planctomycetota bacterium]
MRQVPSGLLANRNFMLLWCAYAVSALGDHLSEMALLATQGALEPGVDVLPLHARISFLFFVPFFVLGPFTGLLADRFPRRGLMVLADAVRCAVMFGFPVLIAWTSHWGSWGAFFPLLIVGAFAALFSPARLALLPTLVRPTQLVRANAMIAGLGIIATMVAALGGGYLAQHYKPAVAFRLDALTFVASAAFLIFIAAPRQPRPHREIGVWSTLGQGFAYVGSHRRVIQLILVATVVWGCGAVVRSSIPAIVKDVYGGDYVTLGSYQMYLGVGFVVGATLLALLGNALRSEIAITWGLMGITASITLLALSVFLPMAPQWAGRLGAVAIIGSGMFAVSVMASFDSLLQRIVPDRYRGRVMGVKDVCSLGGLLLATGLIGIPRWENLDAWVGYILLGVVAILLVAATMSLVIRIRASRIPPILQASMNLNEFLMRIVYRFKQIGRNHVPRSGAVIVVSNHHASPDPLFLLAACSHRPLAFMIAREYANIPIAGFFIRLVDCIPVNRTGRDISSTKAALRHLKAGGSLGIFVEGGIVDPDQAASPKDGAALLALRTGTQVIPAHISGTRYCPGLIQGFLTRHRARVRFGPPVDLSNLAGYSGDRQVLRQATDRIYRAIQALAPESDGSS